MDKAILDKALNKSKIGLMTHGSVFLMTIAFSLRYEWNDQIPTACVDGITMQINPNFFMDLPDKQRIFVIAHEAWHVAFDHMIRGKDKDHGLYNEAGDYVINWQLKKDRYELWPPCLCDQKFANMSTLQVYKYLEKEKKKNPPPKSGGKGNGNPMGGDLIIVKTATAKDRDNKAKVEAQVKSVLVKAMTQSKMSGDKAGAVPGEIARELEELLNPVLPWDILLFNFLQEKTKDDYSWNRPNKRFAPEFYLPTQYSESLQHITIAIDTSGSITKKQLTEILSEIVYIKEAFNPKRLTILDCDHEIHNIYNVDEYTEVQTLKFTGGGGTRFEPVIKYCNENATNALLYFTDLYANMITEEPSYPLLWLCYSKHPAAPVGETIYYQESEHR